MTTFCYYHPDMAGHDPGPGHSERSERITAIVAALQQAALPQLVWKTPAMGNLAPIHLVHDADYVAQVFSAIPAQGYCPIEVNDVVSEHDGGEVTTLSSGSRHAILRSIGAITAAVEAITAGEARNAFCLTRPPGHHALTNKAMGFCVFNNLAIAARYAQRHHGYGRVAIVDFDVHHGNGVQQVFADDASVFLATIHQLPLWPESGYANEIGAGNICNVPTPPDLPREEWLTCWRQKILARLDQENFDLLLIGAGFDAHRDDPKGAQNLTTEDFFTITQELCAFAASHCNSRVISLLEGGYDIQASADSAVSHVKALCAAL